MFTTQRSDNYKVHESVRKKIGKKNIKKDRSVSGLFFFFFQKGSYGGDREETIAARQQIACKSLNEKKRKKKNGNVCTYNFLYIAHDRS